MNNTLIITIVHPGIHTTVQDHGREKFRAFGVPQAGPMDLFSAQFANRLVGNPESTPVLEFTLQGPVVEIQGSGVLAITGAQFEVWLDHQHLPINQAVTIKGKSLLSLGHAQAGSWGYMAVAGEWQLKPWLNSCSTSPQMGSVLTPDSVIKKGKTITILDRHEKTPRSQEVPPLVDHSKDIRILAGPEYHHFSTPIIRELLTRDFIVSHQISRMGYRLDGVLEGYKNVLEVISSGVVPGTVQVTHSGQLIVLMADAQTTGGYPRIANVIGNDLGKLAQKRPVDRIKFVLTSLNEAYEA